MGCTVLLEGDAGGLEGTCTREEVEEACRGFSVAEAAEADVGDAITLGVGAAGAWGVREVGAEAVRGLEAGPFAEQHEDGFGLAQVADFIAERDACLRGEDDGIE